MPYNRTFETSWASHGVTQSGKFAYEFCVGSSGIIQVGWATAQADFDPFLGKGVGDDSESYAFDGHRLKNWHGLKFKNNFYGREWFEGAVVTAMIDLDEASISYMLNGESLGIAFRDIDRNKIWCPAVSLTSDEWGRFYFGSPIDMLQYCPADFSPIGLYAEKLASPSRSHFSESSIEELSPVDKNLISISLEDHKKSQSRERSLSPAKSDRKASTRSPTVSLVSDGTVILDKYMAMLFYYEVQVGLAASNSDYMM
jgi:SPRY domain